MFVLRPPEQLSNEVVEHRLHCIAAQLGCSQSCAFLCAQCCQSDAFLRSGDVHAFHLESESSSAKPPARTLLSCSLYHAPSVQGVERGVAVNFAGTQRVESRVGNAADLERQLLLQAQGNWGNSMG